MIEEQLRSLGRKPAIARFVDHVQDDEDVSGILEDLQETINDYQVCSRSRLFLDIDADQMVQQMAIYDQGCKRIVSVTPPSPNQ